MRTLPRPVRFLLVVAVLDLLALVVVVAICWLGGWERQVDYARGLVYAGMALLAAAGLRFAGTMSDAPQPSIFAGDDSGVLAFDHRGHSDRMRRGLADSVRGDRSRCCCSPPRRSPSRPACCSSRARAA